MQSPRFSYYPTFFLQSKINQNAWAAAFPGPNGQIASAKGSGMDPHLDEIYVMDADDGSDVTRLTNPPNAHYGTIDWGTNTSTPDDDDDDMDKKQDP